MTTAEIGLVTTAIVGVAAAASPALVSWANRKHERVMARSTRLYEQRRNAYRDLAVFLEAARLGAQKGGRQWADAPKRATVDEWTDLMARTAIAGSAEVQEKLAAFHEAEELFYTSEPRPPEKPMNEVPKEWEEYKSMSELHEGFREELLELIDDIEQTMRDELANL
jgi:hypothetical protein